MVLLTQVFVQLLFENIVPSDKGSIQLVRSYIDCAAMCRQPYISFFYKDSTELCLVSTVVYEESDVKLTSEENWRYYRALAANPCPLVGYTHLPSVNMCVKMSVNMKKHSEATAECAADTNGHLVNLHTTAKIKAVITYLQDNYPGKSIYIGLTDKPLYPDGEFHWSDGSLLTDGRWTDGDPDNKYRDDCVFMDSGDNYHWHDLFCTDAYHFMCEIPMN